MIRSSAVRHPRGQDGPLELATEMAPGAGARLFGLLRRRDRDRSLPVSHCIPYHITIISSFIITNTIAT